MVAMLIIPVAFLRTFGVMVGDSKQSCALFAASAIVADTSAAHGTRIIGATLLVVGLEYLPALALGPVADALLYAGCVNGASMFDAPASRCRKGAGQLGAGGAI